MNRYNVVQKEIFKKNHEKVMFVKTEHFGQEEMMLHQTKKAKNKLKC